MLNVIPWLDGRLVWGGRCLPRRSRCAVIASEAGCADLSRGGDRATGAEIGDLLRQRFGVLYHNHHFPRLLRQLGFSVLFS